MSLKQPFDAAVEEEHQPSKPAPFSIRLSADERAAIKRAAGTKPLGAFIREQLLKDLEAPRRRRSRQPKVDHVLLAKVLSELGRSRIANNLNQIARLAHIGALPLTPDVEADVREASEGVSQMRRHLLRALGVQGEEDEA